MTPTIATQVGFKPIAGADHKVPAHHYRMTPGHAYRLNSDHKWEVVPADEKLAKEALPTFCSYWISGIVATEFTHGGYLYAQPIKEVPKTAKRSRAMAAAFEETYGPKREAPGVAPPPPAAQPKARVQTVEVAPAKVAPKARRASPPPEPAAPAEPRAKGLRKKPLTLKF